MTITTITIGSECQITVGSPETFSSSASVNISTELNADIAATPSGDSTKIVFEPGTYGVGGPINLESNTTVEGNDATLEYMPGVESQTNWGMLQNIANYSTGSSSAEIVSTNISVEGLTFIISNAHLFATWFTDAANIAVQNNTYIGGCDGNAFVGVINAVAAENVALGMDNVAYDNWNGPVNVTIEDNVGDVYGAPAGPHSGGSGWNVLINSSIAHMNYAGDAIQYGIGQGDAVDDGVVDNVLTSNWIGAASVNTDALLDHGFTSEAGITQQGNVDEGLGVANSGVAYVISPMADAVIEDDSFVGLSFSSTYDFKIIDVSNRNSGATNETAGSNVSGNLVFGTQAGNAVPQILNGGIDPTTVNNAVIGTSGSELAQIITNSYGTSYLSAGNITNAGTVTSGSNVTPNLDISAPPTLLAPVNEATLISGINISDISPSATIAVTLITTFGTLSIPNDVIGVEDTTVLGEQAIIITGDLAKVNADLALISYQSNSGGWDDTIELQASDTSGSTATRYLPVVVGDPQAGNDQVTTIVPGEVLPELFYTTIAPPSDLSSDTVVASAGNNMINFGTTVSIAFLEAGNDTLIGGSDAGYITTGEGRAVIELEGGGAFSIAGGTGAMTVNAAVGDNIVDVGSSDALFLAGSGANTVVGGLGNATVRGGTGTLYIATLPQDGGTLDAYLGTGDAEIYALSGSGTIATNGSTSNLIDLGLGDYTILSGGADLIYTGVGSDTVNATSGGSDSVAGGSGSLYFVAGANNSIVDPAATTTIIAGAGNLSIADGGSTANLTIAQLYGTTRTISLAEVPAQISLVGFSRDPIEAESLTNNILGVTLSDGTRLEMFDPSGRQVADLNGCLAFFAGSNIQNADFIDLDSLGGFNSTSGTNNASLIYSSILTARPGATPVLIAGAAANGGLVSDGTISLGPADLIVDGPLSGDGVIEIGQGRELDIYGSVASTEVVTFEGLDGTLYLVQPEDFEGRITNFGISDAIDLTSVAFSSTGSASLASGSLLTIVENGSTSEIQLDPASANTISAFELSSDGAGGTLIQPSTTYIVPITSSSINLQSSAPETVQGNGTSNFVANLGASPNVTYISNGGTGSVFAAANDFIDLSGGEWSVVGGLSGADTVNSRASDPFISVYGSGSATGNAIGADTTPSNVVGLAMGNGTVSCNGTNDLIETFSGNDVVSVSGSANVIVNGGVDTVYAASSSTAVRAFFNLYGGEMLFVNDSSSAATVSGGVAGASGGSTTAFGGVGGGIYIGGAAGNNSLVGGSGRVTMVASGTNNFLEAEGFGSSYSTQNILNAGSGGATLLGGSSSGYNEFFGGSGTDSIVSLGAGAQTYYIGATGSELLTGSTASGASNEYIFNQESSGNGQDVITNFKFGRDKIVINSNDSVGGVLINGFSSLGGAESGSIIYLNDKTTIQLYGVSLAALKASLIGGTVIQ